jgi:hypothetical protein
MVLSLWGSHSDQRTGLSFVYAAGPRQRSLSWVRVTWDSRPYFTVSDLRLPFSSPPTTRRVTVRYSAPPPHGQHRKHSSFIAKCIHFRGNMFTQLFRSNDCTRDISLRDISFVFACGHYLATAVSVAPHFLLSVAILC